MGESFQETGNGSLKGEAGHMLPLRVQVLSIFMLTVIVYETYLPYCLQDKTVTNAHGVSLTIQDSKVSSSLNKTQNLLENERAVSRRTECPAGSFLTPDFLTLL